MEYDMIKKTLFILIGTLLLTITSLSQAEVISIIDSDNAATTVSRPKSGFTMSQVEAKFGQAESKSGPVGQPPITTWKYPDFTVYFEYNRVIYSVIPHK